MFRKIFFNFLHNYIIRNTDFFVETVTGYLFCRKK